MMPLVAAAVGLSRIISDMMMTMSFKATVRTGCIDAVRVGPAKM